jgi:hypothetical protein
LTLDAAAETYFMPDFIKVDVEGDEAHVLRGAARILEHRRPAWIIEVHGTQAEADCIALLRAHRYRVSIIDRATFLPEHRPLAHNRWLACEAAK